MTNMNIDVTGFAYFAHKCDIIQLDELVDHLVLCLINYFRLEHKMWFLSMLILYLVNQHIITVADYTYCT